MYAIAASDDPHAVYREMRAAAAVHDVGDGVFFLTRYDTVLSVLRNPAMSAGSGVTASFGATSGPLHDITKAWLMSLDGAAHVRTRNLVSRVFTPRRIAALRSSVEEVARQLVSAWRDEALREGAADLIEGLAFALPSEVIRRLFGFESGQWRERVEPLFRPEAGAEALPGGPIEPLAEYFRERLGSPGSAGGGLFTMLREEDPEYGRLTEEEVVANCVLLVTAAIDTTTGWIANTIVCLNQHREQRALVLKDPNFIAAAAEETLRFEPPALSASRYTVESAVVGDLVVPAGSHLLCSIAAANRDPRQWRDPDAFEIGRVTTGGGAGALTFGAGRHVCLGAALARLETVVAVEALLRCAPDFALEGERVEWRRDNPTIRAPRNLRAVPASAS